MWDVARAFARRVPMTKLVHLDANIQPYLAALMIAALKHHKETLKISDSINYEIVPDAEWQNMILRDASKNYNQYGVIGS